jgi:hypothetical protein
MRGFTANPGDGMDDLYDQVRAAKIGDLIPDDRNANQGTERGNYMLGHSLQKRGAGRGVLLDKHGRLIAGNKTAAKFGEVGLEDVIIVQTTGDQLVATQRMDIDLDTPEGREMAIADNRISEINYEPDESVLIQFADEGVELGDWFTAEEMAGWDVEVPDYSEDEPESSTQEIDVDLYEFDCQCPKCGFQFTKTKL